MSAEECYKKAEKLTDIYLSNTKEILKDSKCTSCNNGKVSVTFTSFTFSSDEKELAKEKAETHEQNCLDCDGTGKVNSHQKYFSLVNQNVWCKCKNDQGSFHTGDGEEVFGNDTYLCNTCGMVTQFG